MDHSQAMSRRPEPAVMHRSASSAFTLIEMMVALAVFGILFALGLPSLSAWIQNSNIRTATEAGLNGLQLARSEAVSRNASVQLVFDPQGGWSATVVAGGALIQSRPAGETASSVSVAYLPADATTVTFNGFGRIAPNDDGTASITQIDFDSTALPAAQSRELRLMIDTNGMARMCDPQRDASDPRAC
jgi:type IV fimbrial biogenesis protein FimT